MHSLMQGRRIDPSPIDWRSFAWNSGRFDMARRTFAKEAEGRIAIHHHLILVTLAGGARQCDVTTDCGHRYSGEDFPGAVSFVPAGCGRHVVLRDVQIEWASISLRPDLLADAEIPTFTNLHDPLIASLLAEFARLRRLDEQLDPTYCDAMGVALAQHLMVRYGQKATAKRGDQKLPAWRLRRITDYVEAHIDAPIQVAELAAIASLSVGHFHRALQATIGQTPLGFITHRRIERARQLLAEAPIPVTELSLQVGFASPSHFSRLFRRATGVSPSEYRKGLHHSVS